MADLAIRATREDVAQFLRRLVEGLAGAGDPYGVNQGIQLRMASVLLSKISQAFVTKSRGGTGEDGIKWPPLKPETIAQRRIGKGDLSSIGIKGGGQPKGRVRGLLTQAQDKEWKKIFGSRKALFMVKFGMSEGEASARAAKIAWAILKASGAKTKLAVLGGRQVDILVDTGELGASFAAGLPGAIMRTPPGEVIVGTNKKPWHHFGTRKIPARNYWPRDGNLPASWWEAILRAGREGVAEAVVRYLAAAG